MLDKHSPDPAFVDRLEARVLAEARRQRQAPVPSSWWMASRLRIVSAAAILAIVSMGVGAAGVAAAYQVKTNEQRDLITADLQRRLSLARQRLQIANETLQSAQQQVAIGVVSQDAVMDAQTKVAQSQAEVESLTSQLAEARATGQVAVDDLTAPAVQGHDYVGDRLRIALQVARASLQTTQAALAAAERRRALGITDQVPVQMAQARVAEQQAAIALIESKLAIRQRLLNGAIDQQQAALQGLEADAVQRRMALAPKLQIAQEQLQRAETLMSQRLMSSVDLAQARLNLEQVQADLAKADLDLALVRAQLQSGKGGGS